jgi:DNA-binding NarL/FixJ family response regulator
MASDVAEIRILAVDDHPLLRKGIAELINAEPDMKLVAEASNGQDALAEFKKHRPDITLMDLQLPEMSGIECIIAIRSDSPDARIIVLTTYPGDVQVLRAPKAGARGFLLKGQANNDLPEVIRAVHSGQKRIPPEIALELAQHIAEDDLSSREIEVLRLVAAGTANKEIARQLCIARKTVNNHVTNILVKLHANDRTHAVTTALKRGIIKL